MRYEIKGGNLPYVECTLNMGERLTTESGAMCWMDDGFTMETSTNGGIGKGIGRIFGGEHFFQNNYIANRDNLKVSFSTNLPGAIVPIPIIDGQSVIIQKQAYLASHGNIEMSLFFNRKFGAGLFGGEGFILQKVKGNGTLFLEVDGSSAQYELAPGQKLIISSQHLVCMSETCTMDIQGV